MNFDDLFGYAYYLRSYHDGEHYNSVRLKDDPCDGPPKSIVIKVPIWILFPYIPIIVKASSYVWLNLVCERLMLIFQRRRIKQKLRLTNPVGKLVGKPFSQGP